MVAVVAWVVVCLASWFAARANFVVVVAVAAVVPSVAATAVAPIGQ